MGQLVEVQVSFQAVPVAKGKYQMLQKLRAICILERAAEEVSDAHFYECGIALGGGAGLSCEPS